MLLLLHQQQQLQTSSRVIAAVLVLSLLQCFTAAAAPAAPATPRHGHVHGPPSAGGVPSWRHRSPVQQPAGPCDPQLCKLPNCRCAGSDIPGGLAAADTPQMVLFSFDDAVRVQDYPYIAKAFNGRLNPDKCQIGLTFFASHNYTNYALVELLAKRYGYDIVDHTLDHTTATAPTYDVWMNEIQGMRIILDKFANISSSDVNGFRAPDLATCETEIQVLYNDNFLYEASMCTTDMMWPFTLDYKSPLCDPPRTCPNNSYPGLWIAPVVELDQGNGLYSCMLDGCTTPQTDDDWYNLLVTNFFKHYNFNRAPFGVYAHTSWFYNPDGTTRESVLIRFFDFLATMQDVFIVGHKKMMAWVQNPTPLSELANFEPWQCPPLPGPRCELDAPTCNKWYDDVQMSFTSCSPCPAHYPCYGNPEGN